MALTQLVIEDFEGTRTVVPLDMDSLTIGRGSGHLIQLTEQNVSRDHAKLYLIDEGWVVEDLGSFNGINVNNVEVKGPVMLREGDIVTVGDYVMQLAGDSSRDTVELVGAGAATDAIEGQLAHAAASGPRMVGAATDEHKTGSTLPEMGPSAIADNNTPLDGVSVPPTPTVDDGLDEFEFDEENSGGKKIVWAIIGMMTVVLGWYGWQSMNEGAAPATSAIAKVERPATKDARADEVKEPEVVEAGGAASTTGGEDTEGAEAATAGDTGGTGAQEEPEDAAAEEPAPAPTPTAAPRRSSKKTGSTRPKKSVASEPAPAPTPAPVEESKPVVQAPTPKAAEPVPTAPSKTASELLAEARKAAMLGKASTAYDLAKQSNAKSPSADAVQVMAVSACKMGSESKAKAAFSRLSEKKKKSVRSLCESKGITL